MENKFSKESIKPSRELKRIQKHIDSEFFCAYYLNEIISKYANESGIERFLEKFETDLEEVMQKEGITLACFHNTLKSFGR